MAQLSSHDLDLIEKHLLERLSEDELQTFQQRQEDLDFQRELEARSDIHVAIKASGREQLRKEVRRWESSHESSSRATIKPFWQQSRWLMAAAAIVLLCSLGVLIFRQGSAEMNVDDYFEAYPADAYQGLRSIDQNPNLEQEAFYYYSAGEYDKAIPLLSELQERQPNNQALQFYRGNAYLASGNWQEAIEDLQEISLDSTHPYQAESAWYLAISYLKGKKYAEAMSMLNSLSSESDNPFSRQADSLLEILD